MEENWRNDWIGANVQVIIGKVNFHFVTCVYGVSRVENISKNTSLTNRQCVTQKNEELSWEVVKYFEKISQIIDLYVNGFIFIVTRRWGYSLGRSMQSPYFWFRFSNKLKIKVFNRIRMPKKVIWRMNMRRLNLERSITNIYFTNLLQFSTSSLG